jgi:paraquat-inducible protein B
MPDTPPPDPVIETAAPGAGGISAVWLVPLLALLLALGIAWHTWYQRGPTIEIVFDNAAGVEAGNTAIRFRDVVVGTVESLTLSPDLRRVVATARIDKAVAHFVDADAQFWIVRPSVNAQGVSGIETVLSGVYVGAFWDDQPGPRVTRFEGLPRAPLTPADQPGLRITLRAPTGGSLSVGAPVLYKSIQVGRIESVDLTDAGDVSVEAFVSAPYHLRLTEGTRFWNASGFSIEIGPSGAHLNVDSLVSLLQGGISFDTVGSDTTPIQPDHRFDLFPTESAARQNLFENDTAEGLLVDAEFDGAVGGLEPGAPVRFRGLQVGEVAAMQTAIVDQGGQATPTLRISLSLSPTRLGVPEDAAEPAGQALDLIEGLVATGGLRARIAASGLLGTSLYVDLAEVADAAPAALDRAAQPNPVIPSVPSDLANITASAQGVIKRIGSLPLEQLVDNAVTLLGNINALVTDDRVRSAPENLGALIADIRTMIDESGIKQAPAELSALLASARGIVDQASQTRLVEQLDGVLADTRTALASIDGAARGVPQLITRIDTVAGQVQDLPLDQLVASVSRLVDDLDRFANSPEISAVPASVNATLAELRTTVASLRTGGTVDNLNATLASVRQVSEQVAAADVATSLQKVLDEAHAASASISAASAKAPQLIDNLNTLSARVNAMPLEDLVRSADSVLGTADTLLASPGMAEVPPNLAAALDELRGTLAALREGGAVDKLNATLTSADQAAASVARSTDAMPALIANLNRAAETADRTMATLGPNSDLNRDTLRLLQELRDTLRSINALVLSLERRPNSVIFGR